MMRAEDDREQAEEQNSDNTNLQRLPAANSVVPVSSAAATALSAAAPLQRTDSLLSEESEVVESDWRKSESTIKYMEEASMEASPVILNSSDSSSNNNNNSSKRSNTHTATLNAARQLKISPSGPRGWKHKAEPQSEVVPERASSSTASAHPMEEGVSFSSNSQDIVPDDNNLDESERGVFQTRERRSSQQRTSLIRDDVSTNQKTPVSSNGGTNPIPFTTNDGDDNDVATLLVANDIIPLSSVEDSEEQVLYAIFRNFCEPAVPFESVQHILWMEQGLSSKATDTTKTTVPPHVPLPDPVTITLHQNPSPIHLLLGKTAVFAQLPLYFTNAVLRLLIRLLTHETDDEYAISTFQKSSPLPSSSFHTTAMPQAVPDHATRRPHILYNVARLQSCARLSIWPLWQQQPSPALARLLGLISVGNITPHLLRKWLAALQQQQQHPQRRLALAAALQTAAAAACRPSVLQSPPLHFFGFGAGDGLVRTISGLPSWPFRNDFGLALWFRAERLGENSILFQTQSDDGGGIQISLVKIQQQQAATIAVSVFDSGEVERRHHLKVSSCVLLPRVWYHLAIRHTRSRLKGVFSLKTRQQISILIDGKLMLTDSLPFPNISKSGGEAPTSSFVPTLRRSSSQHSRLNLKLTLGDGFDGETGALYLFHESVSDASFRALYETTGGSRGVARRGSSSLDVWDSRRSRLVRKSRVLDTNLTPEDADELVLTHGHRKKRGTVTDKLAAVLDICGDTEEPEENSLPVPLQKNSFASKVFLTWDPRRVVGALVIELHMGAHVRMRDGFTWSINCAQDVIRSVGGVQALIPAFQSSVSAPSDHNGAEGGKGNENSCEESVASIIPTLFDLLSVFVDDHNDNARELLRCGGIDVIADLLASSKKIATGKRTKYSLFTSLTSDTSLSWRLVESLLRLETSCSHYIALETKVFARLLFNVPLWFGGQRGERNSLQPTLLPLLTSLTLRSPDRVRACVQLIDLVQVLHDTAGTLDRNSEVIEGKVNLALAVLGIIYSVLAAGARPHDLSPFLNFLSAQLERTADERAAEGEVRSSDRLIAVASCTILLFLMQSRPVDTQFFESFGECCGNIQSGAGWILCAMVNASDDEIRGLGIRCISAYLEVTSQSPDTPLSLVSVNSPSAEADTPIPSDGVASNVRRASTRIGQLAKGLAAMAPVRNIVLSPSRLTARVVYKLLWHFLKGHRFQLGKFTDWALMSAITDDNGVVSAKLSSHDYLRENMFPLNSKAGNARILSIDLTRALLAQTGDLIGKSLRNPLATGTVLRLLRFLDGAQKDKWLRDLLSFCKSSRKCVALLATLPDWEVSLFQLVSDTVESVRSLASLTSRKNDSLPAQKKSEEAEHQTASGVQETDLESSMNRLDVCLDLYAIILSHLMLAGGDELLGATEKTASLQRTCVNGTDVLLLVLSRFCAEIFDHGTILEIGSISAEDWKDVDLEKDSLPLKQSSKLVTNAILSQGDGGLDMPTAVRSWRSLRHLTEVIVATVVKSGLGTVDLFDYSNQRASATDTISGGLHGVRLSDGRAMAIQAKDYAECTSQSSMQKPYLICSHQIDTEGNGEAFESNKDVDRRLCVSLAVQMLTLLDAFIFPESLDTSLPYSQHHGLALVRDSEARLGSSQGPLLSSTIRLSFLLLAVLEPCSVKFLQSVSRLRCLLAWTLELVRESAESSQAAPFSANTASMDRLLLAIVLHGHRALGRCAALSSEIESSTFSKYFPTRESQRKYHRRLLRAVLELRDVVSTTFRGRNDVLRVTLSTEAYEALRVSLEGDTPGNKSHSKESVARDFLSSKWVEGFQDVEMRFDLIIPEQVSMETVSLNNEDAEVAMQGILAVERLHEENKSIVLEFEKALNSCFKDYLESQRKWTETDAVRELEYEGDMTSTRLSEKQKLDFSEFMKNVGQRHASAESRWRTIEKQVISPWKDRIRWKLPTYGDRLGRRMVLTENSDFDLHADASYERALGKDHKTEEIERKKMELAEVMRRNAEAFALKDEISDDTTADEDSSNITSDGESSLDADDGTHETVSISTAEEHSLDGNDESWDKISTEEIDDVNEEGDGDGWAKHFIWSDSETVVARYEPVVILSIQTFVEGKFILSTHGLYFLQTSEEKNVMTKEAVEADAQNLEKKGRRWRLSRLTEIYGRRYMLRPQALELFFADSNEVFVIFPSGMRERDRFHAKLRNNCKTPLLWSLRSLNPRTLFRKSQITELWKKRKITTFEYLMAVNRMAGRSFNDLTNYPVFPWVLADYTSETIDLNDSRVFRDLSKPIGALNPDRLAQLLERYKDLELFGFSQAEKFLYGSHYSSPGIVLHYLIRQEPFTTMAIQLQSGRFDCPDRLFFDIAASWNGCMTSTSDMKELIPEFFFLPEIFLNANSFPLGRLQNGKLVDNVELPPWAKGSAYEFVRINRLALESEYVSQTIHSWIDLIFGFKQRGAEAEAAHNVFHHLSYEGSVDLDKITDEVDRMAAESHIQNFGQTPCQLSTIEPHPERYSVEDSWAPLIRDSNDAGNLRCYTPSKQFANKRSEFARGSVLKILILPDTVLAVYADMSVGIYRWFPNNKTNRLRMEKIRPLPGSEMSASRDSIKRGSEIPVDDLARCEYAVNTSSFSITYGGHSREEQRRKAVMPSNILIPNGDNSPTTSEASVYIVSCGYWDDTVKIHTSDTFRILSSDSGGHRGPIRCISAGNDGGFMVSGGNDGTVCVWTVDRPYLASSLSDGYTQTALGSPTHGSQLAQCCHLLWGHDSPVVCVDLNSDLDVVVSGSESGRICIHMLRIGKFVRAFQPPAVSKERTLAVSKLSLGNSGVLVAHMADTGLHTYSLNGVRLCSINAGEKLNDLRICSDDRLLITGGEGCQVLVRTVADLQVYASLDLSRHGPIKCIGLTPDELNPVEQYLFIGSDDGMITIVDQAFEQKEG